VRQKNVILETSIYTCASSLALFDVPHPHRRQPLEEHLNVASFLCVEGKEFMTKLDSIKTAWESLAQQDALSAILTDGSKSGGRWDLTAFMETGEVEIETVMRHLVSINHIPDYVGTALDFGCGVGRLTQALAQRFASCVGVDISQEMIRKADAFNQHPHCRYMLNSDTPLPFADESFSFIYTNIVLQHMPQHLSASYLREFVRLLTPGGVLVFGVQDSFKTPDVSSLLTRVRNTLHLRSRIRVLFRLGSGDMEMHCIPVQVVQRAIGTATISDVQFTNSAEKDFNGRLAYLDQAPPSGYISKQYCVVK
jgi:ubiquinone/menaquinone biosynthesis C-methylase UbiE